MVRHIGPWSIWAILAAAWASSAWAGDKAALRAYPDPMPEDAAYDTVVQSQPFPSMKYPVTIIGAKVHPEEVHVTPSGELIFPYSEIWKGLCLAPLVGSRQGGRDSGPMALTMLPVEATRWRLVDGCLPAVENQWDVKDLVVRQLAFAAAGEKFESLTGREPLVALVRYTIINKSSSPRDAVLAIQFGQAFGGLSMKATPPVYCQQLSFDPPLVRQKDGAVVACLLTKNAATFKPVGPEAKKNPGPRYSDENRLSFALPLKAGESKTVELGVPYFPLPEQAGRQLGAIRIDEELARFREFWSNELNRNAQFVVPEQRVRDAYRACLANNLLLIDRDPKTGVLMPHPDATAYEAVWAGDGSVSIQAMDRMGFHKECESMLDYFLARQGQDKPEGDVQSAEGYLSGDVGMKWMDQDGFVLWALAEHYKLTHDEAWLRRVAPQLVKGCDWIARERARTKVVKNGRKVKHYGLLPKGRPSDLYIWDNWYWTDTYSYMGLRGTVDVLAAIGMKSEATRLAAEADDYKACIVDSVNRSMDAKIKPPFVPPTPYRLGPPGPVFFNDNWYSICSPMYMVEAGLLDARDEKISGTAFWLEKLGLCSGLPTVAAGVIDPFYVYNQSLAQLLRGEPDKFVWTLYSLSAYGMAQGTYATIEGHNLVTGFNGENWDANRQPHMHSNSRYMDMLRIAMLLEEGQTLHLMAGTPRGWLADGKNIEVKRSPSYFGEVNFTAQSRVASGEIAFQIEPTPWQAPQVVLHVRPPTRYGKIKGVKVNGAEWKDYDGDSVRLPRLDKTMRIVCVF